MDSVLRLKTSSNNKHAISAQHLASTVRLLTTHLQNCTNINTALRDLAMERLAQAISTAMSANCIYGNKRRYILYYFEIVREKKRDENSNLECLHINYLLQKSY